jgi:hypothetical protein
MSSCSPIDRLMQTLKVTVPGVTDELLSLQLFNTMDEFFKRTLAWRYATEVLLEENTLDYGFSIPADTQVVRVIGVTHQGIPMASASAGGTVSLALGKLVPELTFGDGDATFAPERSDVSAGLFTYAVYKPESISITVLPTAEQVKYPLNTILALTLAQSCLECGCDDWQLEEWMYDTFFQDFLDGTLGRLFAMPMKPWASSVHAQYHGKRFRNHMAYRKQEANRGFNYGAAGWVYPRGGWT